MSFIFSLIFLPVILVGFVMSTIDLFKFCNRHPKLSFHHAAGITFAVAGIMGGLLAAPWMVTAGSGLLHNIVIGTYLIYLGVGLFYVYKWGSLIFKSESTTSAKGDCGCPDKSDPKDTPKK